MRKLICNLCGSLVEMRVMLGIYVDKSCTNPDCTMHGFEGDEPDPERPYRFHTEKDPK